jgi:hypothetical protein
MGGCNHATRQTCGIKRRFGIFIFLRKRGPKFTIIAVLPIVIVFLSSFRNGYRLSMNNADTSRPLGSVKVCIQGGPGCRNPTPNLFEWTHTPGITTLAQRITAGSAVVVGYDGACGNMPIAISGVGSSDVYTTLVYKCDALKETGVGIAYTCRSAGGYNRIEGQWTGPTNYGTGIALELSGTQVECPDGSASRTGGSSGETAISVGPITPSVPQDFFFNIAENPSSLPMSTTWNGATFLGTGQYGNAQYVALNSTNDAAQTAAMRGNNISAWASVLAAFK